MTKCACCNRPTKDDYKSPDGFAFCSTECACYAGRCSVREGWINIGEPLRRGPPKVPWNVLDHEWYYEKFGWSWSGNGWVLEKSSENA